LPMKASQRRQSSPIDLAQVLYLAAVALGGSGDAEEVVRVAIAEIQRATRVDAVALHLLDGTKSMLILREFAGTSPDFQQRVTRLPLSEAPRAAQAIQERRVVSDAVETHPTPALRSLYGGQGFRHMTVVPVPGRQEILGVLHLARRRGRPLAADETVLVQAIAGLVGTALENATLRELMTAQQDRLRALAEGTFRAREEEARRIARELHDEAGQLLASVHIALDDLAQRLPEGVGTVRRVHELLDRVEGQLRRLSRELRPTILDDLGLTPALEWLAQGVAERTGMTVSVQAPIGRLPSAVETVLYRVVQEALANTMRHAQANSVVIEVRQADGTVHAMVRDDGQGFDVEAVLARRGDRGLGLIGMRERVDAVGGRLLVASAPGRGTEVVVTVPVNSRP
jgi:signal transduction histidine kinase